MEDIIGIAIIAAAIGLLVNGWEIYKKEKSNNKDAQIVSTRDLFIEVLTRIGGHCHIDEENEDVVIFDYSAEHFIAVTSKDSPCVHIHDAHWMSVNAYNINEVANFKKAINDSNIKTRVNTYYEIDKERMKMVASSKIMIIIQPSMPQIDIILKAIFVEFIRGHRMIWEGVYNNEEAHNA